VFEVRKALVEKKLNKDKKFKLISIVRKDKSENNFKVF